MSAATTRIPIAPRTLRVMVVDDQPDIRSMVKLLLRNHDVDIDTAADGGEAIDRVTSGARYDLVFMDLGMPRVDGYEAIRRIRGWERERGAQPTPIVAVSAHRAESDKERCRDVGCDGYVEKPVWRAVLVDALKRYAAPVEASPATAS